MDRTRSFQKGNSIKKYYVIILIFSLLALSFSLIIAAQKIFNTRSLNNVCSALTQNKCETVQTSNYARILGVDITLFGMIGFLVLVILSLAFLWKQYTQIKYILLPGCILAGLTALWLLYVQAFILHAYCAFCLVVDLSAVVLLCLGLYVAIEEKLCLSGRTSLK
jgi:uncharacterized membrane protein